MTRSGPAALNTPPPACSADLLRQYNAVDILDLNVVRHPQKTAVYTGDDEFSFEAMATMTNKVANALRGMDVRMGDSVAILCLDTAEWTAAPGIAPTTETAETLVRHCTDSMSAYKRPRWIEFLDELPKTATGKIQRFRLR